MGEHLEGWLPQILKQNTALRTEDRRDFDSKCVHKRERNDFYRGRHLACPLLCLFLFAEKNAKYYQVELICSYSINLKQMEYH